ncbi:MAG: PAS domain-containing protein [Candidatus Omnitrophica bacterium]|nr:PAS domain-containing protein [Candidatus Omnitrophota bacterium]
MTTAYRKPIVKREIIQARFVIAILLLILIFLNMTGWLIYYGTKKSYDREAGRSLVSFVTTISSLTKTDSLKLLTPGDEETYLYKWLQSTIRNISDTADVDNLYIFDNRNRTLVDIEDGVKIGSKCSKIKLEPREIEQVREGSGVYTKSYYGKDGKLYKSAYAPIKDRDGVIVGILGTDATFRVHEVVEQLRTRLFWIGVVSLFPAVALSIILTGPLVRPIRLLNTSLIEQMNYNEYILKSISGGVLTINPKGQITTLNKVAMGILELYGKDVIGKDSVEVLKVQPELANIVMETLKEEKPYNAYGLALKTENKGEITIALNTSPLRDKENKVIGAAGFFTDITEMKELQRRVHLKEKLAALGELSAGLAHEIRNPLEGIQVFAELLKRKMEKRKEEGELADNIIREIKSLNTIITEFLNFARPTRFNIDHVRINNVIDNAISVSMPRLAKGNVDVHKHYTSNDIDMMLDADRMKEVFLNLIINAQEAMTGGGNLDIYVKENSNRHTEGNKDITKRFVEIEFANDGPPIPAEDMEKIFNPFFTTKTQGTGLGLAIVHKVIEGHGGTISVESKEGERTKFIIRLPVNGTVV